MNFRGFLVFRQDRSAVRTDPVALATWTTVRQPDLAVFLWHFGARLPSVALERMTIDHLMLALVGAAAAAPQ